MKKKLTILATTFVVMITVSVLFISTQKENREQPTMLTMNIEALVNNESSTCRHDGTGESVYNIYYKGCYYSGFKCYKCGVTILFPSTAMCLAR